MKTILHKIKIWFKNTNVEPKEIVFYNNKINVITGDSTKGKSSIFAIIDYCLLSYNNNIAHQISEAATWFGIEISFNDTRYVICRQSPSMGRTSEDVFFKMGITMPENAPKPTGKINLYRDALNKIFECNKYNFRDTLLYVFLTENIIADQTRFLDTDYIYNKFDSDSLIDNFYRFIGSDNEYYDSKKVEYDETEKKIEKITKDKKKYEKDLKKYEDNINELINLCVASNFLSSKSFLTLEGIPSIIVDSDEAEISKNLYMKIDELQKYQSMERKERLLSNFIAKQEAEMTKDNVLMKIDELQKQKSVLLHKQYIFERYEKQCKRYKSKLKEYSDCLKPIVALSSKFRDQLIDYPITKEFVRHLEYSLKETKRQINALPDEPLVDYSEKFNQIKNSIKELDNRIEALEKEDTSYDKKKYAILGEISYRFKELIDKKPTTNYNLNEYLALEDVARQLKEILTQRDKNRDELKSLFEFEVNNIFQQVSTIDNYLKNSNPIYFVEKKRLMLQYSEDTLWAKTLIENLGSKSNFMFLHICFFLGLHRYLLKNRYSFIPSILLIDQPSLPYFASKGENNNDQKSDEKKLKNVFEILNNFITYINQELHTDFQIIMLEHAEPRYWKKLENFATREEFFGRGLYPDAVISR
ncbi:MAG: DUF3732 domain-containing protein [Bacteroidales bacterium]|nr:DUF3732 domain-containing protein [Bacteroidales bacterium]